jgi:hypothetical protein
MNEVMPVYSLFLSRLFKETIIRITGSLVAARIWQGYRLSGFFKRKSSASRIIPAILVNFWYPKI